MKKQMGHVDLETGEVLQGVPFWESVFETAQALISRFGKLWTEDCFQ
jgi:hypothetical protein